MSPYDKKTKSYKIATAILDNPGKSILFSLVLLAILVPGLQHLTTNFSYRIWFMEGDPLLERFDQFERRFGNDEQVALVVHSPSGIFDEASVTLLQDLTEESWMVDEVIRVDSLANFNWTHAEEGDLMVEPFLDDELDWTPELYKTRREIALNHEDLPGYLISEDGNTSVIFLQLKPAIGGTPDYEIVMNATRKMIADIADKGDHEFHITGSVAINQTFKEVTQSDMQTMVPMLLIAIVVFLVIFFRKVNGVILPFVIIITSITGSLGFAGWNGIQFNNLTSIVPNILIAIGIADAVHILVTFFQFRGLGLERYEAAHKTLVKNFTPTLLTSISTSIGFFSFLTVTLAPVRELGILAGFGTLLAWIVTIFLVCPLLPKLPGSLKPKKTELKHDQPSPRAIEATAVLKRFAKPIIAVFVVLIGTSTYLASQAEINANPFEYFASDVPTRIANEFAEDHVGGMSGIEISIDSGSTEGAKNPEFLTKVQQLSDWMDTRYHVTKTISMVDIIKSSNRALNDDDQNYYVLPNDANLVAQEIFLYTMSLPQGMDISNRMSMDNRYLRLTAMSSLYDSAQALEEYDEIEAKAKALGLDAHVTGKIPLYQSMNPHVVNGFVKSLSLALILVSILMVAVLGNVRVGLLSMIPNTVPLIFGGALMTLLDKPLDIGTVLVASTCLGIAVDDTIHFLTNYNRWRNQGADRSEAVAHVITHTGPALFVTTVVLIAGFATFAFSSFVPNINFGIMTAAILSAALITDFTLLPALLLVKDEIEGKS